MTASDRASLEPRWQRAFDWVEATLGGRLVSWDPQLRWRPAWFFELERKGERLPLYWRGARPEFHDSTAPLVREQGIIEVLERHGVPVPHAYGICEDPPGLLLECSPGRINLATEPDEELRVRTLDHYLEILARIHAIDVGEFEALGLRRPKSAERSCLGDLPSFERLYRSQKKRPDPFIEFELGWLARHVPTDRPEVTFLVCDSGQFLFDAGRVTALLDFELAYLGDPAADLAGLRTRDVTEPLGDLSRAMQRYAELSGRPVDAAAIDYHTIRFAMVNPLSVGHLCHAPLPSTNWVQYQSWYVVYGRLLLEVQARRLGIALDPPALPDPQPTRRSGVHRHLVEALEAEHEASEGERAYEIDRMARVAAVLERADQYGAALAADSAADAETLLGAPVGDGAAADAALEAKVEAAGPDADAAFIRLFHRRLVREEFLLAPFLRELADARMPPID